MAVTKDIPYTDASTKDLLARLGKDFDPQVVKYRTQGGKQIPYISIDQTINRLNEVLDTGWSTRKAADPIHTFVDGKHSVIISIEMDALGKVAFGIGADTAADLDKAAKTALAEAIKKAGHQFDVGLELWDEGHRDMVAKVQAQVAENPTDEVTPLKTQVLQKALKAGVPRDAKKIAAHFGVSEDDLKDIEKLKAILNG